MNQVRSLLSMHCMLLGYNFEPGPNINALGTAGSVMNMASMKGCTHSKTQLLNSAFVSYYEELWRSRRVLSVSAINTLLGLHNSS